MDRIPDLTGQSESQVKVEAARLAQDADDDLARHQEHELRTRAEFKGDLANLRGAYSDLLEQHAGSKPAPPSEKSASEHALRLAAHALLLLQHADRGAQAA